MYAAKLGWMMDYMKIFTSLLLEYMIDADVRKLGNIASKSGLMG
jgi:hypothetical protein